MFDLTSIPTYDFLISGGIILGILLMLALVFRRRKPGAPGSSHEGARPWRTRIVRILRLAGFGIAVLVLILAALLFTEDYKTMLSETAPAPHSVELPADAALPVEEATITARDGISLRGWYVPAANGATIILLHGYGGDRASMLWHAQTLVRAGYGVLLYDERASGESGGARRSYGWEDGPDVGSAMEWIKERTGETSPEMGIVGCSVGGQIALQGAILYPEIAAVWADGPANVVAADSPPPQNALSGLFFLSDHLLDFLYAQHLKIPAPQPIVERIDRIAPRPVMLVGGGREIGALGSESPRVTRFASFAGANAQVWVIPQAVHCDGPTVQPEEYARRLVRFFDETFTQG
jgi:hypothetical protein